MKLSKKMIAVAAAAGLAMGTMPAAANAQGSEGLLDLDLGLNIGTSVNLGVNLGLGSLGVTDETLPDLEGLAGSVEELKGATNSSDLASGSDNLGPALGDIVEAGSSEDAGSGNGSSNGNGNGSNNGDGAEESIGELIFGSLGSITEGAGSDALVEELTELGSDSGSKTDSDELEAELGGISSESLGESGSGSNDEEEAGQPSFLDRITEWFDELFDTGSDAGSDVEGEPGTGSDSASDSIEDELGGISSESLGESGSGSNDEETTDETILDRIGEFFDGIFSGSSEGSNSGEGSNEEDPTTDPGQGGDVNFNSAELDAEVLLAVGSLAAAGIAVGIAVNGGVQLPPLPAVDAAIVCTLPQEGIDFLKSSGSMQPDECLPEEQN